MKYNQISILSVLALSALTLSACGGKQADNSASNDSTKVQQDSTATATSFSADFSALAKEQGVSVSGKEGNYTYVDLGLKSGTKWATFNVGANKPTEYGDYFAWGETKAKKSFTYETYKWNDNKNLVEDEEGLEFPAATKYCVDSHWGKADNQKVLLAEDDAASANWGSAWRMPTLEEQNELQKGCKWNLVANFNGSGVTGMMGISKVNGDTIFFPAGNFRDDFDKELASEGANSVGMYCECWSSSIDAECGAHASFLNFYEDGFLTQGGPRYEGRNVRAVLNK